MSRAKQILPNKRKNVVHSPRRPCNCTVLQKGSQSINSSFSRNNFSLNTYYVYYNTNQIRFAAVSLHKGTFAECPYVQVRIIAKLRMQSMAGRFLESS